MEVAQKLCNQMIHDQEENNKALESVEKPTIYESLTKADFRKATLLSLAIAFFNQMSGVNIVNGFSSNIFQAIAEKGAESSLSEAQ
mmetsp:Transcript_1015/g.1841  ORF Transcript_1015/g.1841 Transcript_1015/m.1841 type:complete len:86 (+) Transcript_1015:804-1061(+)